MRIANNRSDYLAAILIAGVVIIILVHYLRDNFDHSQAVRYVLGVAPNFIAGFTLPVVFISIKKRTARLDGSISDASGFFGSTVLALAGAIAWEVRQSHLTNFTFDPVDIGASVLGAAIFLCCWPMFRRFMGAA